MNKFINTRVEFHILQSFPVTCLNRDDLGSPKTAIVGGVTRARVSSQCWKRYVRQALHDGGVTLAVRTKHLKTLTQQACLKIGATESQAEACAECISGVLADDTLIFVSDAEVESFAKYAQDNDFKLTETDKKGNEVVRKSLAKDLTKVTKSIKLQAANGLDIALFGRMVAKAVDMNIEAAASFSHAISTHKVAPEVDFFTALDDCSSEEDLGSSHMGSLEFDSATYYRYVCLDLGQLAQTLGCNDDEEGLADMKRAIDVFIKALYVAVPKARQSTQAGFCGWDYAHVFVRHGQPLQFSCETPVKSRAGGGYLAPSQEALEEFLTAKERMSGSLFGKKTDYVLSQENGNVDELIKTVQNALTD